MKMVKVISILTLITLTAITLYSAINAKKACEECSLKYQELKGRLYDVKTSTNALSEQLSKCRLQIQKMGDLKISDSEQSISDRRVSTCLLQA